MGTIGMDAAQFSSFLVKVASRCNLDCDYCYVYHHADQSWRSMPKTLSDDCKVAVAQRIDEYSKESGLSQCAVIFHGGEPLLAGVQSLVNFANLIRQSCNISVDVSIQTNGLLLTNEALEAFRTADIGVSLSLDGPKSANDKHRLTVTGRSSFLKAENALIRLHNYPEIFSGVIAVIDVSTSAIELFEYFDRFSIPRLDFLLPDATWDNPPQGRNTDPTVYECWLIDAFDTWFDKFPHISLRTFESLLDACAGLPSGTDAFGFGDVSLLSIETDGSYHDLDVLKVTKEGSTILSGNVFNRSIADIATSPSIEKHRNYLSIEGLSDTCRSCDIVEICGGGALPHRFGNNSFTNPTIYCGEMKRLIVHVKKRLSDSLAESFEEKRNLSLPEEFSMASFEYAETATSGMDWLVRSFTESSADLFYAALRTIASDPRVASLIETDKDVIDRIAQHPGAIGWSSAALAIEKGQRILSMDGNTIIHSNDYLDIILARSKSVNERLEIGSKDFWLRAPFGKEVEFECEEIAARGKELVLKAIQIIKEWRPALAAEIFKACRAVQFVRDPNADPEKIVSFSDNSVPGALYVSISQGADMIDPYDLADSIIHEHRHQKLYLLERHAQLIEKTDQRVVSPWREDLRPPTGLLHAIFVFVELRRFWIYVRDHGPEYLATRANNQLRDTDRNLKEGFDTLNRSPLTTIGKDLTHVLKRAGEIRGSDETILEHPSRSLVK